MPMGDMVIITVFGKIKQIECTSLVFIFKLLEKEKHSGNHMDLNDVPWKLQQKMLK